MIELIKAVIYGIVEGITEWLPISSTGHMILLNDFLKLNTSQEFWDMFLVVIQLGAILAVIVTYFNKLIPRKTNKYTNTHHWDYPKLWMWLKIIIATIPSAIVGLFLDDYLNKIFYNTTTVAIMLIVFGILFLVVEPIKNKNPVYLFKNLNNKKNLKSYDKVESITFLQAFIIGLFQVVAAVLPGTSRSGATIIGALILGISRGAAAEFTFFLAIPAMLGSSLLKLIKFGFNFTSNEMSILLVGTFTAFIISLLAIKFFIKYIKNHTFEVFGIYRIGLGLLVIAYFGIGFIK